MRQITKHIISFIKKGPLSLAIGSLVLWASLLVLHSCTRTVYTNGGQDSTYLGRLQFVIKDNSTFSAFYTSLQLTGYLDSISGPGPYTALVTNNDAYTGYAYIGPGTPFSFFTTAIGGNNILPSYIGNELLPDKHPFGTLPLQENQELTNFTGKKVYVTRYLSGSDTMTTVNGQQVISLDNPASNGVIEVLTGVPNFVKYPTVLQQIQSDTILTYFAAALQRTHLDTLLQGDGPFTVLAPVNNAFLSSASEGFNLGINITSIDSILKADPVKLANLIKYHILSGRYFLNDFWRRKTTDSLSLTMYNGETIKFTSTPYFPSYFPAKNPGPAFIGKGNGQAYSIYNQLSGIPSSYFCQGPSCYNNNPSDWPADNGVVQKITTLLIP